MVCACEGATEQSAITGEARLDDVHGTGGSARPHMFVATVCCPP